MKRRVVIISALVVLSLFAPPSGFAQRGGGASGPGNIALSPDGAQIAWTLRDREGTTLHVNSATVNDPSTERLVAPDGATNCSNTAPVWSPDSQTLAFTSTCTANTEQPAQAQIFLWSRKSGEVRQLTHLKGNLQQAAWSPDGRTLGFLFVENATRSAGALDAMKPLVGVIGEDTFEVQGVYGIDVVSGKGGWIVPAANDSYTYEFAWAPDSKRIAAVTSHTPGENNWWIAKLTVWEARQEHAQTGQIILDPQKVSGGLHGLQVAVPRWSPDGKRLSFIGGLMSDQGSTGGDVWVVDSKGGEPVDVTAGIDGTACFGDWISDHTISFVEDRRGHTLLSAVNINTLALAPGAPLDLGEVTIGGGPMKDAVTVSNRLSGTKDRVIAFTMSGLDHGPDIYTMASSEKAPQQYTHFGDSVKSTLKTESVEWTNEGFHVQGWLTYPANYDAKKRYPIIVTVHGGPSASSGPAGGGQWAQAGYFEFRPNPRGSFGQGEAFTQANRKDFGYGDLRDILAGLDMLEAKFPIDKRREGLTGWSYGGFMSMFAATQTHRFAAIVAGAGISDWLSYYGENSIDQWMIPFFGASVYDDPDVYAKSSAMSYIKKARTPMLILVGDRDGECPAPQSFEMWHALRDQGVKTQLVVYPNEGHGFRDPAHIKDRQERTAKWFADNMPGEAGNRK